ncbi:L-serine ammonia-lyase, iron-sulfur-dependent subunit beta [Paenibacillus sacheonensis]|uniref:L-serine deaminase n=1 Tax=Paenibacillus sacheonensis TaxID=742054 RepID=A0A7X5BVZ2_9BACL|nr:L-serine ammonia-lyase, iron-sulfur-dependent subunit beta [Paenibacillus sacheonensis]MBM7565796.1 L-serine dehydratase [Paenibacillus sacheonensis]NBC68883.1 L-serine ammonia-lyase, iron-sulfur-dependent, subunit beta [Paenibacillus sacheonensis]
MRFKDVFSIIGPGMIGPSSSHTAGAVRLGRVAGLLFGGLPKRAEIMFYGSFAATYAGHGTDLAAVAGLLGFDTDDERIPDAIELAEQAGMRIAFRKASVPAAHPNTLTVALRKGRRHVRMTGCSIGGGSIEVSEVDGFELKFTGNYPTLIVFHDDRPGMLAAITRLLGDAGVNIGYMDVDRKSRLGEAATVIESDAAIPAELRKRVGRIADVKSVGYIDLNGGAAN